MKRKVVRKEPQMNPPVGGQALINADKNKIVTEIISVTIFMAAVFLGSSGSALEPEGILLIHLNAETQ